MTPEILLEVRELHDLYSHLQKIRNSLPYKRNNKIDHNDKENLVRFTARKLLVCPNEFRLKWAYPALESSFVNDLFVEGGQLENIKAGAAGLLEDPYKRYGNGMLIPF